MGVVFCVGRRRCGLGPHPHFRLHCSSLNIDLHDDRGRGDDFCFLLYTSI